MRAREFLRIKNRMPKWRVLTDAVHGFFDNDLTTSAAAISYYAMLMLFPLLIVLLSAGQSIFGGDAVRNFVLERVLALLPGTKGFVRENIEQLEEISVGAVISCVVLVFWASTWIFTVIEKAINRIWGTRARTFLHGRLVTTTMIGLMALLLGLSTLITAGISVVEAATGHFPTALPHGLSIVTSAAWQGVLVAASLVVTILLFAVIYWMMPNTTVSWIEVLPGAVISGIAWEGLKHGFALLLPRMLEEYRLLYGGAWLALVLLTWVYISSLVMLFGAQMTAVLHCRHEETAEECLSGDQVSTPAAPPPRST